MTFKFIDLFAGIGGFHIALSSMGGKCVLASEIDKFAVQVYRQNFEDTDMYGPIVGDIVALTEPKVSKIIPEHDVLVGGFPCQPFSKGGFQLGIQETRGTLFYNIAKILEVRRPKYILLENVRNLTGPKHRHTWALIIRTLRDLGYHVSEKPTIYSPHLLDPSQGGSPQVRDRVYIFGYYVGKRKAWELSDDNFYLPYEPSKGWDPKMWDLEKDLLLDDAQIPNLEKYVVSKERKRVLQIWEDFVISVGRTGQERTLPGFPLWEFALVDEPIIDASMPDWKVDFLRKNSAFFVANKSAITAWRRRNPEIQDLSSSFRKFEWQAGSTDSLWKTAIQFRPSGIRVKKPDYLPALVAMNQTSIIGSRKRAITVREAARLQAFPDNFIFGTQPENLSYKQLGNAVSVGVVKHVFYQFLKVTSNSL
jgi:DNA (cytosine-5)-methyltransferase 1